MNDMPRSTASVPGNAEMPLIAVYIITFRRPLMFQRALQSVLSQTYPNISVRVVNDAPDDNKVEQLIVEAGDRRVGLYTPVENRGATRNFNLAFCEKQAGFVSILEDDNWWEPEFLAAMYGILCDNPNDKIVVGNETVWTELRDGSWRNTGRNIWDFEDTRRFRYSLSSICGSAKLCNSSMLVRLSEDDDLRTPENIPVDVTEHFRERLLEESVILCGRSLVNYAETLHSARGNGYLWGQYQMALIASAFAALPRGEQRIILAKELWSKCDDPTGPRAVTLASAGFAMPEARSLLSRAPPAALLRTVLWVARKRERWGVLARTRHELSEQMAFLVDAPLTRKLSANYPSAPTDGNLQ